MPSTEFLRDASVLFLRKLNERAASQGKSANARPERLVTTAEGAVGFPVDSGEERLEVFVLDIAKFLIAGDGFSVMIPIPKSGIPKEKSGEVALFVNKINSFGDVAGKFVIRKNLTLAFTLETVFPKSGDPDPERVAVALYSALAQTLDFYARFGAMWPDANADDWNGGWDIGDLLTSLKPD